MDADFEPMVDLAEARRSAESCANVWGLELGTPFALSNVSFVAPVGEFHVLKSAWEGDDESLHEGDALELWRGEGAVRLDRRRGRVLLEERALPGDDLSSLDDDQATAIAVELAERLWRPAMAPFRPVNPEVSRWLDEAEGEGSPLVPLARELFAEIAASAAWVVHGDFHHHNILRHGERYVAIDPKPYLSDREYDVASFLWNPIGNRLGDRASTERRIAAFVEGGLDDYLIRAWTVIRGAYLRTGADYVEPIRALLTRPPFV
ncbi:MAG TPA: aminoglycoside phosphotransferase family protein [Acidimicrobiales bacterium]|nr:aminoglycoside phosphotransferase family protein [Acidimicrobiales bacterium]